jgi:hydroxymethylbilane synthase
MIFLKVGTRGSSLATVQTNSIINELSKLTDEKVDMEIIKTTGDKIQDSQVIQHRCQRNIYTGA